MNALIFIAMHGFRTHHEVKVPPPDFGMQDLLIVSSGLVVVILLFLVLRKLYPIYAPDSQFGKWLASF